MGRKMPPFKSIKPLVNDDGTHKVKPVHTCTDCKKTFRSLYNFAIHRAMVHKDWSVMQDWAEKTGRNMRIEI